MSELDFQEQYPTLTFHELQHFRGKKEESLKTLERRFNYNMKIVSRRKKQMKEQMEQTRKRENFMEHKRNFSEYIDKLKKQNTELTSQRKEALKNSIQIHRQQKTQNVMSLKKQLVNAANFSRFERHVCHNSINKQKISTFRYKRKLYKKQRENQSVRKLRQEERLSESRKVIHQQKMSRIKTQYSKLQLIDGKLKTKKSLFEWHLRKAVDQYHHQLTTD